MTLKDRIRAALTAIIRAAVNLSGRTRIGVHVQEQFLGSALDRVTEVCHNGVVLKISTPNLLCTYRARSYSSKEPETLEWIDSIPKGSTLWDIGANIGLYSVYAAKVRDCRVWSFEPSVFNLESLARNIFLNGLTERVCIVPLALSNHMGASQMRMTSTEWGGALSTFGEDFGWDGKKLQTVFEFQTIGLSMEDAVQKLEISQPDYIKIDVDGIEHLILSGGASVLRTVRGVLVEVNDAFQEQSHLCTQLLNEAGLVLSEKRHADFLDAPGAFGGGEVWNQIWIRA